MLDSADGTTVVVSGYAPSTSTLPTGLVIDISGGYPFSDNVTIAVGGAAKLKLRVPCWSTSAVVRIDGGAAQTAPPCAFFPLTLTAGATITVVFVNEIKLYTWQRNGSNVDGGSEINGGGIEVHRGALLYALRPASTVNSSIYKGSTDPRIKVHDVKIVPDTPWNYGILPSSLTFVGGGAIPSPLPFDADAAPAVKIVAQARRVPGWTAGSGARGVASLPASPLHSSEPLETIELVPYGSTNIRISVFPQLCDAAYKAQPPCVKPPAALPPNAAVGLNLPAGDLVPGGVTSTDPASCFKLCEAHRGCTAWTFSSAASQKGEKWCWLKNASAVSRRAQQGYTSAVCKLGSAWPCARISLRLGRK